MGSFSLFRVLILAFPLTTLSAKKCLLPIEGSNPSSRNLERNNLHEGARNGLAQSLRIISRKS